MRRELRPSWLMLDWQSEQRRKGNLGKRMFLQNSTFNYSCVKENQKSALFTRARAGTGLNRFENRGKPRENRFKPGPYSSTPSEAPLYRKVEFCKNICFLQVDLMGDLVWLFLRFARALPPTFHSFHNNMLLWKYLGSSFVQIQFMASPFIGLHLTSALQTCLHYLLLFTGRL